MSGIQQAIGELSSLLRCPVTGQQLHIATPEELKLSSLSSHDADGFLVREDGGAAYPVKGSIPALLSESLIALTPTDQKPES
jgi:uncharacterized protein YbaR (Trm112 family)